MSPDLSRLLLFSDVVVAIVRAANGELTHRRPADGSFALVEHVWHLADLEEEGYAVRIRRMLSEGSPELADFRGDDIARQRAYLEQDVLPALQRFVDARRANCERLAGLVEAEWRRVGVLEGRGPVTVAELVALMIEHDRSHAGELVALLRELGMPLVLGLADIAGEEPVRRSA
jgi:uncharacterized damage-inducible protein DinB